MGYTHTIPQDGRKRSETSPSDTPHRFGGSDRAPPDHHLRSGEAPAPAGVAAPVMALRLWRHPCWAVKAPGWFGCDSPCGGSGRHLEKLVRPADDHEQAEISGSF